MVNSFEKKSLLLECKLDFNQDEIGYFEGIASTNNIDRVSDIVEIEGIEFKGMPAPLLLEHLESNQIGYITGFSKNNNQLQVNGSLDLKGEVKSKTDINTRYVIRDQIKEGKMFLSIGYYPLEYNVKTIDGKEIRVLNKIMISEISAVKNPANIEAKFLLMKNNESEDFNDGIMKLNKFYEEINSDVEKNKQERKRMIELSIGVANTTFKKGELIKAMKMMGNSISEQDRCEIYKKFYKRCDEKYNTKEIEQPKESMERKDIFKIILDN